MDTEKIGKRIMNLRRERGLTQEALAEQLHVSAQAVSKWENARALPETALLPGLAKALDTTVDALLTDGKLQILSAFYGDGIESCNVTERLNRLIGGDVLELPVTPMALACPLSNERPAFLTLKYQLNGEVFYGFARSGERLRLAPGDAENPQLGLLPTAQAEIVAAVYGTQKAHSDVMHKIEHYKPFQWEAYAANHETFPSNPANDARDWLTFVYLHPQGIAMAGCAEGESIAYNADHTALAGKKADGSHFIPWVPGLPSWGEGMDCSWAAALTSALQAMGVETDYTQVMGVSGACYRLAFSSPGWDYSSVDGLVAYDYATPGYKAFGFTPEFADRVEKENRAKERERMLREIRCNMPVLGINLRVAAEWGVICGCRENGAELLCRSKYDAEIIDAPDYENGRFHNPYDYLPVDNWPFIITYFGEKTLPPSPKENLMNSLRVFVDCAGQPRHRGYVVGLEAYTVWQKDLLDESWYKKGWRKARSDEQFARRLSVNQFCALALLDARKAARDYLSGSVNLIPEKTAELTRLAGLFACIAQNAESIHRLLDSGENLQGEKARVFWTSEKREAQAALLMQIQQTEEEALRLTREILR